MSEVAQLRRPSGSIVGRSADIRGVRDALEQGRLVNLVGPGGVGKTTLAAEVINELEPDFDRAVLVELAAAVRGADIRRLLATAAVDDPAADMERVIAALSAAPTLVVLDNCEHLIDDVVSVIGTILDATSEVTVLTTSRRPLDMAEERAWPVQPLTVAEDHRSDRSLTAAGATQLFLERVRQSVPSFELTDANRSLVAQICAAADGVPLVLELAAALVRGRPLDLILEAMTERPDGLTTSRRDRPDHQRSLAASLDWSRRFLSQDDGDLLNRLSVFVGGFTATAARHVDPDGTADGLSRLVDHSLVSFDPEATRYRILEVVRVDAVRRLDPTALAQAERGHYLACAELAARIEAGRFEADPDNLFPRYELELPNLGAALRRCYQQGDLEHFRALLGPIAVWLVHYMGPEDPNVWLSAFEDPEAPLQWRANIISALSFYWSHRGRHAEALDHGLRAARMHAEGGDRTGQVLAELSAGNAHLALGERQAAGEAYRRALDLALQADSRYGELAARVSLARLLPGTEEARRHLTEAHSVAAGFGAIETTVNIELGVLALNTGRLDDARRICDQALAMARRNGYAEVLATALSSRADVAVVDGDHDLARRHYEEALMLGRRSVHQGVVDRAGKGLADLPVHVPVDHRTDNTGHTSGGNSNSNTRGNGARGRALDGELSERELAVARLLRGDLTQREIADELYIAPSTVKTHVKSIYRKLGVTKRSYAITRATELGLFDATPG